jgi:hypothetical protein
METGFEAAKGAAEKVFGVKLPILMRLILPGLLATAVIYPFVGRLLSLLPQPSEYVWMRIAGYALLALLFGALISTASTQISRVYEGRALWPESLREWARLRQQKRILRLTRKAVAARAAGSSMLYNELWYELRAYPMDDDGQRAATHPTRMGNILAESDQYAERRYGMDSVFYWSRIWLQIEKDRQEEIDNQWCVAEGFVTLSAISVAAALLWTAQLGLSWASVGSNELPFGSAILTTLGIAVWLVLVWLFYRISIPYHRANSELYKAIFDVYREKVWNLTVLKPHEAATWTAAWGYLQYMALKCPNCKQWTEFSRSDCGKCGFGMLELKRTFMETGQFPLG